MTTTDTRSEIATATALAPSTPGTGKPPAAGKPAKPGKPAIATGVQLPMFPADAPTLTVKRAEILIDEGWNARRTYDPVKIQELAESIRERGQLMPGNVLRIPEGSPEYERGIRYRLIAGYRRAKALDLLGIEEMRVTVGPMSDLASKDGARAAKLTNLSENLDREDLTTYELAEAVAQLHEGGLTIDQIAGSLKKSAAYFYNITRALKRLAPELLEAWRRDHPGMTAKRAIELSTLPHAVQVDRWKALGYNDAKGDRILEAPKPGAAEGEDNNGQRGGRDTKPTSRILRVALEKLPELDLRPAERELAQSLIAWVLGEGKAPKAFGRLNLKVARGRPATEKPTLPLAKGSKKASKKGGAR
jgi:ParB/RepB/Spo0J family partition protein